MRLLTAVFEAFLRNKPMPKTDMVAPSPETYSPVLSIGDWGSFRERHLSSMNCKLLLGSANASCKVQRALFEIGFRWANQANTEHQFLNDEKISGMILNSGIIYACYGTRSAYSSWRQCQNRIVQKRDLMSLAKAKKQELIACE